MAFSVGSGNKMKASKMSILKSMRRKSPTGARIKKARKTKRRLK